MMSTMTGKVFYFGVDIASHINVLTKYILTGEEKANDFEYIHQNGTFFGISDVSERRTAIDDMTFVGWGRCRSGRQRCSTKQCCFVDDAAKGGLLL